jgi:hypothetical protein
MRGCPARQRREEEDVKFNYAADRDEIVKEESVSLALVIDI